jgi:hypothetical protein
MVTFTKVVQHLVENEGTHVTVIGAPESIRGAMAPFVRVVNFAEIRDDIIRAALAASPRE